MLTPTTAIRSTGSPLVATQRSWHLQPGSTEWLRSTEPLG